MLAYPVGSVYQSAVSTSPADVLGGEWTQIKDRFLLAAGDTYTNGSTGGEATHTLSIAEIPSHEHSLYADSDFSAYYTGDTNDWKQALVNKESNAVWTTGTYTGGGQAHNNMPPYIAVYTWYRTN